MYVMSSSSVRESLAAVFDHAMQLWDSLPPPCQMKFPKHTHIES